MDSVSVLFNEPKLLKSYGSDMFCRSIVGFSALQRAEIAEMFLGARHRTQVRVSVLFNEPKLLKLQPTCGRTDSTRRFSALQRAEIAEMQRAGLPVQAFTTSFSALQRAEIAEMLWWIRQKSPRPLFQCSSTSRNC